MKNTLQLHQRRFVLSREIPLHNFGGLHTDRDLKDRRPTFHVHSRKIFLVPPPGAAGRALLYSFLTAVNCRKGSAWRLAPGDMRYGEETGVVSKSPSAGRVVHSGMLTTTEQRVQQGATIRRQNDRREGSAEMSGLNTARLSNEEMRFSHDQ